MKPLLFLSLLFALCSCGTQYQFVSSEETPTDDSPVYTLPYPEGTTRKLVQGYNSSFSHRGRLALDFKMPEGSAVTAAREGVVVRTENSFSSGGARKKYLHKGNYVVVRHSDGSQAYYGHLKHDGVLVQPGDSVKRGQLIARSGSTGYSAFPHMHLIVWGPTAGGGRGQIPTRFYTKGGIKYLRPGKKYKAVTNTTNL